MFKASNLKKYSHIKLNFNKFNPLKYSNNIIQNNENVEHLVSNHSLVKENIGLKHFLKRVYIKTGFGVVGSLATASSFTYLLPELLEKHPLELIVIGAIASFGSIFAYNNKDYKIVDKEYQGVVIPIAEHSAKNKISFATLSVSTGLTMAPLLLMTNIINPLILPTALILSTATMTGATFYAMKQKDNNIRLWRSALYSGLTGLIAIGCVSLITYPFFPEVLHLWSTYEPYFGIALFTAMSAYDTQIAIDKYKNNDFNDLDCAISLFLNFINLLIRFMEILAKSQKK